MFGLNITQNNSKNLKWHCWTLSIWIKCGQWILREKTNFLNPGRKWARLWFGIFEEIKIKEKFLKNKKNTRIIEYDGS